MLEVADHTGQISVGYDADLIVLERNPLEYLKAYHDPLMVVNNGKVILNRIEWKP